MFRDAVSGVFKASDISRVGRLYKVHVSEMPERKGGNNNAGDRGFFLFFIPLKPRVD